MKAIKLIYAFMALILVAMLVDACAPMWQVVNNMKRGYYTPALDELHIQRKEFSSICPDTNLQQLIDCYRIVKEPMFRRDV